MSAKRGFHLSGGQTECQQLIETWIRFAAIPVSHGDGPVWAAKWCDIVYERLGFVTQSIQMKSTGVGFYAFLLPLLFQHFCRDVLWNALAGIRPLKNIRPGCEHLTRLY